MGQLPASELDPHIAQEIANSRDHQTHITWNSRRTSLR